MAETVLTYEYDYENKGYMVTGFSSIADDGKVIIPSIYDDGNNGELPVKRIESDAFIENQVIREIDICNNLVSIGERAFKNSTLERIIIDTTLSSL